MRDYNFNQMKKLIFNYSFLFNLSITLLVGCENTSQEKNKNFTKKNNDVKSNRVDNGNQLLAPDFTLVDLDGNNISLSDLKGKVVLLNFWGTWCGPCRKEIPDFINLSKKYKKNGLEIVGITLTSGPPKNIKAFAEQWGINYKLLTDITGNETQTVTALYGQATGKRITGIPTTFIIDREGYIRHRYVGPRSEGIFYKDLKTYL